MLSHVGNVSIFWSPHKREGFCAKIHLNPYTCQVLDTVPITYESSKPHTHTLVQDEDSMDLRDDDKKRPSSKGFKELKTFLYLQILSHTANPHKQWILQYLKKKQQPPKPTKAPLKTTKIQKPPCFFSPSSLTSFFYLPKTMDRMIISRRYFRNLTALWDNFKDWFPLQNVLQCLILRCLTSHLLLVFIHYLKSWFWP